ncbi:MAG TPA: DHH family phosphoesterase, partial [Candidatus Hypogeohydataceae bacterium YC40]
MYIILGCNTYGRDVAQSLSKEGHEVVVYENDEKILNLLKQINHNVKAILGNPVSPSAAHLEKADVVAILGKDPKSNLAALKEVRKHYPDKYIITIAHSTEETSLFKDKGANVVIESNTLLVSSVLEELEISAHKQAAANLAKEIKEADTRGLAIFLQDNPDPDAIASGLALKRIAEKCEVVSKIYYGGNIGHHQNRALVNLLGTELIQLTTPTEVKEVLSAVGKVALVEASTPSKNNILPEGFVPDIIVDHHQTDISAVKGRFVDIEYKIGATSTILTRYLRLFGIKPDAALATVLLYGIKVDTMGFTRNTTAQDMEAVAYLSPLIDHELLKGIESPPMSSETLDIIGRAIRSREIRGSYLVSFVEFINDRDALPQAADMMLQLEGVDTVLVSGISGDKVHLSARSRDPRVNLGLLLQKAFGQGSGGHPTMAAGTIELGIFGEVTDRKALLKVTSDAVKKRFFSVVGAEFEKEEIP